MAKCWTKTELRAVTSAYFRHSSFLLSMYVTVVLQNSARRNFEFSP